MSADQKQALRLAFHLTSREANPSAMQCTGWRGASAFDTEQSVKWCLTPIVPWTWLTPLRSG
jgi:hypothetical protein